MQNTSQDPDFYGPTGHEKRFHKTHFGVVRTLKSKKKSKNEWVRIAPGKYKLIKKDLIGGQDAKV